MRKSVRRYSSEWLRIIYKAKKLSTVSVYNQGEIEWVNNLLVFLQAIYTPTKQQFQLVLFLSFGCL